MNYDKVVEVCENLHYRDKLRLAQLLIQLSRKEEETQHPANRAKKKSKNAPGAPDLATEHDTVTYIAERIAKLRPNRRKALANSIKAMFQFQGGISDSDVDNIIVKLQRQKYIEVDDNNHVTFS